MSEHQYKVGDRVRVLDRPHINKGWRNETGAVQGCSGIHNELVSIRPDGRDCTIFFSASDLEPLTAQQPPVQSAGQSTSPTPEQVQGLIADVCNEVRDMLVAKNQAYGNSALDPVRIFSKADPIDQLNVRIDDKLSRLARVQAAGEDVEKDLIGYLVLKQVAQRLKNQTPQ